MVYSALYSYGARAALRIAPEKLRAGRQVNKRILLQTCQFAVGGELVAAMEGRRRNRKALDDQQRIALT